LSSSAPELEGVWTEVKRKTREKPRTPKKDEEEEEGVEKKSNPPAQEELDFMFDEEIDELDGRKNHFTDWSDDEDDEIDDNTINKILIMTQTPPSLRKHPGGDRTGDHMPRSKMTAELAKIINDSLFIYEREIEDQEDFKVGV
jgi:la-related protein 1